METLVIFTYQGNLVKYDLFRTAYDYFLPQSGTIKSFNINFDTNKDELHQLHYSGNLGDFSENISIHYYHVDLENDILYADCDLETQNRNSIKACWLSFTNLDQIHLYNPKK
ncbi:hypothetical protein [Commensalibacter communis]|nr:hypothetical protein [Commensalibacter communis]CAI3952234.1 unnamed protein product [Commensalibacter communis]CAI3954604.1 unnamed protein product [Commensalibacter communis]